MEALYQQLAQLATTYAARICHGMTLSEHEALCYMHTCRAIEAFTRFQTASWYLHARILEKQAEEERVKEDRE